MRKAGHGNPDRFRLLGEERTRKATNAKKRHKKANGKSHGFHFLFRSEPCPSGSGVPAFPLPYGRGPV